MKKQILTPTSGSIHSGFYSEPWQRSASILCFQVEEHFLNLIGNQTKAEYLCSRHSPSFTKYVPLTPYMY